MRDAAVTTTERLHPRCRSQTSGCARRPRRVCCCRGWPALRAAEKLLVGEPFDANEARPTELVNEVLLANQVAVCARARAHFRQMLGEAAAKEAFSAFLEKRKADFSKVSVR
ncbi:MAG: hypothetical protein IT494_09175 [Gammaproteobacteria bacterium]|nr:hypothetical protein [Gammaproteobacteria bacterium]